MTNLIIVIILVLLNLRLMNKIKNSKKEYELLIDSFRSLEQENDVLSSTIRSINDITKKKIDK